MDQPKVLAWAMPASLAAIVYHIIFLFTQSSFGIFLQNSAIVGAFVVIIMLLLAIPLAVIYGLFFNYLVGGFRNAT